MSGGIADLMAGLSSSSDQTPAEGQSADELEPGTEIPDKEETHEPAETKEEPEEEPEPEPEEELYEVKVQGEKLEVNLDELKAGYMKGKDYTQKSQDLSKQRKEFERKSEVLEGHKQEITYFFQALKNPETVLQTLKAVDPQIRKAVAQAVEQEAAQMLHELTLSEEEQHKRARARQQAEFEEEQRRLQGDRERLEAEEEERIWTRRIEVWVPAALEAVGLPNTDRVRRLMGQELTPLLEQRQGTEADFKEAAQAIAEEWPELLEKKEETETEGKPKAKTKAKHPPAAPKRSSGGRTREAKQQNPRREKKPSSDFFNDLRLGKF